MEVTAISRSFERQVFIYCPQVMKGLLKVGRSAAISNHWRKQISVQLKGPLRSFLSYPHEIIAIRGNISYRTEKKNGPFNFAFSSGLKWLLKTDFQPSFHDLQTMNKYTSFKTAPHWLNISSVSVKNLKLLQHFLAWFKF
jgi:hypothetical protein